MSDLLDQATAITKRQHEAQRQALLRDVPPEHRDRMRATYTWRRLELAQAVELLRLAMWDAMPILGRLRLKTITDKSEAAA